MTYAQSKQLKIGDRLIFSDGVKGKVIDTGYHGFTAKWEDGQVGQIAHEDAGPVKRSE